MAQKRIDKLEEAGIKCEPTGYNGGYIRLLGYTPEMRNSLERERQEYAAAYQAWYSKQNLKQSDSEIMDTNNLDKWWYGLPGNTRQAIGNDGIWEKLDMPSRSALHRYSRLRIYGTAKDRDEERTLLNEIACGLGDLALVRKNGIALEEMCNGNGEFYNEYQEQFNILYDNYGHTIENISWPDWIGHTIPTNRELGRLLEHHGYKRMEIDTDRRIPKTFYVFRRGLHINASEDLSYHIVPQQDSFGLGRFAVCATKDGESFQLGTDCARLFLRRFLAFLKGERSGKEIIDEICNNRQTER